jgi:Protein of unknown function (DUF1592)/Protein of unknown function (DUF1588)/PA14 domain/Protein of unknown function (DUF1595)/Cytochrome C oxidase, cbb3-type, subunit III
MSSPTFLANGCRFGLGVLGLALAFPHSGFAGDARTGEQIYRQTCASCHGASGEGTPNDYPKPLVGDRSVVQLSKLIAKTMPEDDPGTCVGEDADRVASYIYETFYSPAARERNRPARVQLSRLTVRQYRNTVADLIGSFREKASREEKHGLQAEYFKTKQFRRDQRVIERIDPMVRFNFGASKPEGYPPTPMPKEEEKKPPAAAKPVEEPKKDEKKADEREKDKTPEEKEKEREQRRKEREKQKEIEKKKEEQRQKLKEFSIRWQGSVFAPESGDYEVIVRTDNAFKLWVNDPSRPLIDASVKSGNDTEYRQSIRLLGGRAYTVRLEFFRGQEKTASIALEWKPPQGVVGVIPERYLAPTPVPATFVASTPFPPDDRSIGYERGSSISAAWEQATTEAAIEVANYVVAHLRELTNTTPSEKGREARLREFCRTFAERAFRRPLTDQEIDRYVDRQFARSPDAESGVKRVVLLTLKSPYFLYREAVGQGNDPHEVASRISFGLWDSLPDAPLLQAAAEGKLSTREQVAGQAERMAADPRTRAKLRDFFFQWLKVDPAPDLSKDREKFPGFDDALVADLRTSLDLFLDDVVWGESSDYRQLLLADFTYLNGRLGKFYGTGADLSEDASFRKVALNPEERAGLLSHPYLMATFAYSSTSSPIHRGVFLSRNVLGRALRPPPEAVAPLPPDLHAGLSTRERIGLQTRPAACMTCHGMINPLGYSLERFDAVGRLRAEEKGRPVDASGSYQVRSGETVTFEGARELGAFLARLDETQTAFVEHLFHNLVKQPVLAYGSQTLPDLRQSFLSNEFHIRKLVVAIVAKTALSGRDPKPDSLARSIP